MKVKTPLIIPFKILNGIIAGINILTTISLSTPKYRGVIIKLAGTIIKVIANVPKINPKIAPFLS